MENVPHNRELVIRISAYRWRRVEEILFYLGWALGALIVPVGILVQQGESWTSPLLLAMGALACVGFGAVTLSNTTLPSALADKRESRAGYTTILLPYRPELDLVDPATGTVIRAAGEQNLSKDAYKAALAEVAKRIKTGENGHV